MKVRKYTNSLISYGLMIVILLSFSLSIHADEKTSKSPDTRISLGLTANEKNEFLIEMRQMLSSIQGIMMGIGQSDRELIISSARYSGNRMARATPQSIKEKTPLSFERIGGPTHMMFEELVVRAETDDMDMLAELTGELMKNCLQCHATFKVD